ncbi:PPC domain-containing protein [Alteriqipengyuania flavescens]|uniref:PPC domain-containing protein n=1 Tax=Alteriqipengyuania flavescens TaxID=3053610 RepID=UPI0025B53CB8|nr:PPC domain-containing protein [Alteriqipengyuania flavescens]WJY17914.1 PPC domain-containing protein [Alteriqipengyuania flavescens]WJY23855.1 PPC domain-containing protein [Alteriqipengyuania flavescens]
MIANRLPLALLAAATMLAGVPAAAQDARNLDRADNDLRAYSDTFAAGGEAKSFTFTVPANQQVVIQVIPREGGDSLASLYDADSGELVAEDDDGGFDLDSRIELKTERRRRFRLDVSEYQDGEDGPMGGPFDILLRTTAYVPPRVEPIAIGGAQKGMLQRDQGAVYRFTGRAGQLVSIRMTADDIDPRLALFAGEGTDGEEIAANDDAGDGLNSLIRVKLPADGVYTLRADTFDGAAGAYALSIEEIAYIENGGTLALGTETPGDFSFVTTDGEGGYGTAYAEYSLSEEAVSMLGGAGGSLVVDMMSGDMDSTLQAGFATPLGFASALDDDDGGEGLDARLVLPLECVDAAWLRSLRLRALSAVGDGGPFTMLVRHDADGSLVAALQDEAEAMADAMEDAADEVEAEAEAVEAAAEAMAE